MSYLIWKNQPIETDLEMIETIELSYKDFKTVVVNMTEDLDKKMSITKTEMKNIKK